MSRHGLPSGYEFRDLNQEEFSALQRPHAQEIFHDTSPIFEAYESVSPEEQEKWKSLGKRMGDPWQLRLGVFKGAEFVGWHFGRQAAGDKFYMQNSAVVEAHRKKGIYAALVNEVVARSTEQGFQMIYSRHMAMNNAVIIPKLKAGFFITAMELTDVFGLLIHLTYFTNPLRRKVLEFRTGETRPDDELRRLLKI